MPSDFVEKRLESNGWMRDVAGEDFDRAVQAICAMNETGRGLLITGEAGCGKTALMRALHTDSKLGGLCWYYCKEAGDVRSLRASDSDALRSTVFVDDIGAEEIVREYGNRVDVIGDFIQRYHYRGKGRFIATTNLHSSRYGKDKNGNRVDLYGADQLNEIYGGRVIDRLFEMCVILNLKGGSKRERVIIK